MLGLHEKPVSGTICHVVRSGDGRDTKGTDVTLAFMTVYDKYVGEFLQKM